MATVAYYELRRTYAVSADAVADMLADEGVPATPENITDVIERMTEDLDFNKADLSVIAVEAGEG